MSEENTTENTSSDSGENLNNIKEEFNRKLGNVDEKLDGYGSKIEQVLAQNQALIQQLNERGQERKVDDSGESESLGDLLFSNPDAAIKTIAAEVAKSVKTDVNSTMEQQNRASQTLNQLVSDFPELGDENHDLTKEAVKIYSKLDQNDPNSYRLAVQEAALNQGIKPRSRRKSTDSYTMSGSSSARPQSKKNEELDDKTAAFAQLMGLDISDEKTVKRLQERSKRNFGKYQ